MEFLEGGLPLEVHPLWDLADVFPHSPPGLTGSAHAVWMRPAVRSPIGGLTSVL